MVQRNDDSKGDAELAPAAGEAKQSAALGAPDLRRRRLVRGAAAGIVPAILTLRSGGVAASSGCAPLVAIDSTDNGNGRLRPPYTLGSPSDLRGGEKCLTGVTGASTCTTNSGKPGVNSGTISGTVAPPVVGSTDRFCTGVGNNTTVHIISATSVSSLMP